MDKPQEGMAPADLVFGHLFHRYEAAWRELIDDGYENIPYTAVLQYVLTVAVQYIRWASTTSGVSKMVLLTQVVMALQAAISSDKDTGDGDAESGGDVPTVE
jgi:hypothetical protein